jgi:hypothetical protein
MHSIDLDSAVAQIDAAIDVLESIDLSGLSAGDLVRLAGRCERLVRRQVVVRGDIVVEVNSYHHPEKIVHRFRQSRQ